MILLSIITAPILASAISLLVRKEAKMLNAIALLASMFELSVVALIVSSVVKGGSSSWGPYFFVDSLGALLLILIAIVGCAVSFYGVSYIKTEVSKGIIGFHRVKQFFVLLHLFLFAMFFAIITTSPVLMWISIEATTLSTAFLISFYNKPSAIEAAWKYLIINSIGLLLAFLGTLMVFTLLPADHQGWISWASLLGQAGNLNPAVARMAFIFILIGYGTKMGLAPMHTWLPDAHSKAPVPISSLLSGVLLNVAFLGILRFKAIIDVSIGFDFSRGLLIFLGVFSTVIAAFIILAQKNYKRLLAYSSIEHMGVMAVGFGFGGLAAQAALLHLVYHALAKSSLFLSVGNIFLKYGSTKMANVRGVISKLPVTGPLFIIGFLAITGIPPFGIFFTEFSILAAGIGRHPAAVIIMLLSLVLVFVGFLRHAVAMMFGESEKDLSRGEFGAWTTVPIIILLIILAVLSVMIPAPLESLLKSATLLY
ncbi:MAG: hydrogenase 4 subunit F [Candidatus Magasanikbacteria bacterium]|nr:hydrogenase 4 subunit F [Candidatus Magasanikbacteria bacterium]